jgi:hypothetical protein
MDKLVNEVATGYGVCLRRSIYRTSIHCHRCSSANTHPSTPGPLLLMLILCIGTPAIRNASLLPHTTCALLRKYANWICYGSTHGRFSMWIMDIKQWKPHNSTLGVARTFRQLTTITTVDAADSLRGFHTSSLGGGVGVLYTKESKKSIYRCTMPVRPGVVYF